MTRPVNVIPMMQAELKLKFSISTSFGRRTILTNHGNRFRSAFTLNDNSLFFCGQVFHHNGLGIDEVHISNHQITHIPSDVSIISSNVNSNTSETIKILLGTDTANIRGRHVVART